jgi:hypothetical protein
MRGLSQNTIIGLATSRLAGIVGGLILSDTQSDGSTNFDGITDGISGLGIGGADSNGGIIFDQFEGDGWSRGNGEPLDQFMLVGADGGGGGDDRGPLNQFQSSMNAGNISGGDYSQLQDPTQNQNQDQQAQQSQSNDLNMHLLQQAHRIVS